MNKNVVACVEDLFFRSKIEATARHLNVPVKFGTPELMPEFRKDLEDGLERPCIMRGTCAVLICPKI